MTASGATAVQIAEPVGGRRRIVDQIGCGYTEADLATKGSVRCSDLTFTCLVPGAERVEYGLGVGVEGGAGGEFEAVDVDDDGVDAA